MPLVTLGQHDVFFGNCNQLDQLLSQGFTNFLTTSYSTIAHYDVFFGYCDILNIGPTCIIYRVCSIGTASTDLRTPDQLEMPEQNQ